MQQAREKQRKNADFVRRTQREEMMSSRREWIEVPSPVFELPYRFEHDQWENFELILDSFTEKDFSMVDEAFKTYLRDQWLKQSESPWSSEKALNILRVLFRLGLASKQQARALVRFGVEAEKQLDLSTGLEAGKVLLKVLKEIAIHLEETALSIEESLTLWEGETQELLNQFISSLHIYRQIVDKPDPAYQQLFKEFRVFYIVLLADRRIKLEEFVKLRNVGELYYLINDCIDQRDAFELGKSIELIKKMLRIRGSEEVAKSLEGVLVLLTEGVDAARRFLDGEPFEKEQRGVFFKHFLSVMSQTDVINLLSGIELLALLFDQFDQCIPAALSTRNPVEVKPSEAHILKAREHESFTSLIKSLMENLAYEVRLKSYWLVSNITGSAQYYHKFGLTFISHIYENGFVFQERSHQPIVNEITICVLNYLCNVSRSEEIQELLEIVNEKGEEGESRQPNCFLFCLEAAANMLESICLTADFKSKILMDEGYISMIHRSAYALFMVFQHADANADTATNFLERAQVGVFLEKLHSNLETQGQHHELADLIGSVQSQLSLKISPL